MRTHVSNDFHIAKHPTNTNSKLTNPKKCINFYKQINRNLLWCVHLTLPLFLKGGERLYIHFPTMSDRKKYATSKQLSLNNKIRLRNSMLIKKMAPLKISYQDPARAPSAQKSRPDTPIVSANILGTACKTAKYAIIAYHKDVEIIKRREWFYIQIWTSQEQQDFTKTNRQLLKKLLFQKMFPETVYTSFNYIKQQILNDISNLKDWIFTPTREILT